MKSPRGRSLISTTCHLIVLGHGGRLFSDAQASGSILEDVGRENPQRQVSPGRSGLPQGNSRESFLTMR